MSSWKCPPPSNTRGHLPFGPVGRQLSAYLLFQRTRPTSPSPPPALKATQSHMLSCQSSGLSCPVLERLLGCQALPPAADATLAPASRSNAVSSHLPAAEHGCCERQRLCFPRNQSEPLPFPDLEISDGAWRVWETGGQEAAKQLCH